MRTIQVQLYQFDELKTPQAKEKARQWLRDCEAQDFDPEYEPYETAAALLGITLGRREVGANRKTGVKIYASDIRWDLSYCQGAGASFVGTYAARPDCSPAIRKEFPQDETLHGIADALSVLHMARRLRGQSGLTASVTQDDRHYCHMYTMALEDVSAGENGDEDISAGEQEKLLDLMRTFAQWIYDGLESDYQYRLSDEQLDETMRANEYEFTPDGARA